jgi:hypothetical protein
VKLFLNFNLVGELVYSYKSFRFRISELNMGGGVESCTVDLRNVCSYFLNRD